MIQPKVTHRSDSFKGLGFHLDIIQKHFTRVNTAVTSLTINFLAEKTMYCLIDSPIKGVIHKIKNIINGM